MTRIMAALWALCLKGSTHLKTASSPKHNYFNIIFK